MIDNLSAGVDVFTANVFTVDGETPGLVDAGANYDVVSAIEAKSIVPERLVLTHTHPDHIGAVGDIVDAYSIPVYGFDGDHDAVSESLEDGETIALGDGTFEALHTPGHCPDHLCLYDSDSGILFAGDLFFYGGNIGRTDLEGGNAAELARSVKYVAERTADSLTAIYAGHGAPMTEAPAEHLERARKVATRHADR